MFKKYLLFPIFIVAVGSTTAMLSYQQSPGVTFNPDSQTYLDVVAIMMAHPFSLSSLVNPVRLPGYPLFLSLLGSNLLIATIVQLCFFVAASMLTYWITLLTFDVPWIALCCGLLVASNSTLVAYFKQIMSEALACTLLTLLTLLCILYLRYTRLPWLLGAGGLLLVLIFTRPEWAALPLLLFPLLLLRVKRQKPGLLLRHILAVILLTGCIYGCVGLYIQRNGEQNGYHGLSAIENMNLLGKVLQYHMEDEAPASQQAHTAQLTLCIAQKESRDPWQLMPCTRDLANTWASPAGAYAGSIVVSHPLEYLGKSFPLFFTYLIAYFDLSPIQHTPSPLSVLAFLHRFLYQGNIFFPFLVAWPLLFLFQIRRKEVPSLVWIMVLLWGVASYGSLLVAFFSYSDPDSMRFHTVFSPIMTVMIWGSLLFVLFLSFDS